MQLCEKCHGYGADVEHKDNYGGAMSEIPDKGSRQESYLTSQPQCLLFSSREMLRTRHRRRRPWTEQMLSARNLAMRGVIFIASETATFLLCPALALTVVLSTVDEVLPHSPFTRVAESESE